MSTQDESVIQQRQCPECARLRAELESAKAGKPGDVAAKLDRIIELLESMCSDVSNIEFRGRRD